jgi:hypothetical protein
MEKHKNRNIGTLGTIARVFVGLLFLSPLFFGRFQWFEIFLGLIVVPGIIVALQRMHASKKLEPLRATGVWGFIINLMIFLAFYLTPLYFPPLSFTSDVVLIFYGGSMLLAALLGYAGCEVTAISNWILRRDDQIGCVVFTPIDYVETRWFSR